MAVEVTYEDTGLPGIMLGISFVLLNNVAGHLGLLRNWTPWLYVGSVMLLVAVGKLFEKGLRMGMGQANVKRWVAQFQKAAGSSAEKDAKTKQEKLGHWLTGLDGEPGKV